jgi:hypothetical protein
MKLNDEFLDNTVKQSCKSDVSNSSIIKNQFCPKCREKESLKYKSYLMFSRVCKNDGTYVKLPTHPDYGK